MGKAKNIEQNGSTVWTPFEQVELVRLKTGFGAAIYAQAWSEGLTDQGDPWAAAVDIETEEMVLHLVRSGDGYTLLDRNLDLVARGTMLRGLVTEALTQVLNEGAARFNLRIPPEINVFFLSALFADWEPFNESQPDAEESRQASVPSLPEFKIDLSEEEDRQSVRVTNASETAHQIDFAELPELGNETLVVHRPVNRVDTRTDQPGEQVSVGRLDADAKGEQHVVAVHTSELELNPSAVAPEHVTQDRADHQGAAPPHSVIVTPTLPAEPDAEEQDDNEVGEAETPSSSLIDNFQFRDRVPPEQDELLMLTPSGASSPTIPALELNADAFVLNPMVSIEAWLETL